MSEEIIKVLNYIGEKLSVAIDWTAENVWPQVMDILERFRILKITSNCLWLVILIVAAIILIKLWTNCIKAHKTCIDNGCSNFWWAYVRRSGSADMEGTFGLIMLSVFGGIPVAIGIPCVISNILRWLLVPEIKYLEMLKTYIQ